MKETKLEQELRWLQTLVATAQIALDKVAVQADEVRVLVLKIKAKPPKK